MKNFQEIIEIFIMGLLCSLIVYVVFPFIFVTDNRTWLQCYTILSDMLIIRLLKCLSIFITVYGLGKLVLLLTSLITCKKNSK